MKSPLEALFPPEQGLTSNNAIRLKAVSPSILPVSIPFFLHVVLAAVLAGAAVLKVQQLLTGYVPGQSIVTWRISQLLAVESELALAIWLVSGFYRSAARRVAIGYFLLLAGVSAYLLTTGAENCGCLGRFPIHPWFTFAFNVLAVCCLSLCCHKVDNCVPVSSRPHLAVALLGLFSFLGLYVLIAGTEQTVRASEGNDIGEPGALVVLDVENWEGKTLPVLDFISISDRLRNGQYTLIFFHRNCSKCDELIEKATEMKGATTKLVLIEVPSFYGSEEPGIQEREEIFLVGTLGKSRRWVVETPQSMTIVDGVVTKIGVTFDGTD